jgi:hypothetical protein
MVINDKKKAPVPKTDAFTKHENSTTNQGKINNYLFDLQASLPDEEIVISPAAVVTGDEPPAPKYWSNATPTFGVPVEAFAQNETVIV